MHRTSTQFLWKFHCQNGDVITARIPRYKEEKIGGFLTTLNDMGWYVDREFDLEESAIEIIIKSDDGRELRRDRSVDYNKFLKK